MKKLIFWLTATLAAVAAGVALWQAGGYWRRLLRQPLLRRPAIPDNLAALVELEHQAQAIAAANLRSAIEPRKLASGRELHVLCAGRRNFREPWARDFGFASFGLAEIGEYEALKETLELFLIHQQMSGQFPVKIHSTSVADRYLHSLFGREQPTRAPLKPKYKTAHNTISLDGNALLVVAALNYIARSGDDTFARLHWPALKRAITWAERHALEPDGLLHQAAYADWADSVARRGRVLYPNVVYWKALHDLAAAAPAYDRPDEAERLAAHAEAVKQAINQFFWRDDLGYFVASAQFDTLSSPGNLLAVAWELASPQQAASILDRMDAFDMANPVPTQITHQPYPSQFIAIENRLAGIGHYHSSAAWLWVGAWHIIALARQGRVARAEELLARAAAVIVRDGAVHEVYDPAGHFLSTRWYTSEAPLTWSAGMLVYAGAVFERHRAQP
ncbi:MAG: hypothetical protein Kow0031_35250 [Anaerolineae bacterium]